jgi:hypothetical protein
LLQFERDEKGTREKGGKEMKVRRKGVRDEDTKRIIPPLILTGIFHYYWYND